MLQYMPWKKDEALSWVDGPVSRIAAKSKAAKTWQERLDARVSGAMELLDLLNGPRDKCKTECTWGRYSVTGNVRALTTNGLQFG